MNADSDIDKELCRPSYYSSIFITINGNVKIKGNCCLYRCNFTFKIKKKNDNGEQL